MRWTSDVLQMEGKPRQQFATRKFSPEDRQFGRLAISEAQLQPSGSSVHVNSFATLKELTVLSELLWLNENKDM